MRRVDTVDPYSGQRMTEWRGGSPSEWMDAMKPSFRVVTSFNDGAGTPLDVRMHVYSTVTPPGRR